MDTQKVKEKVQQLNLDPYIDTIKKDYEQQLKAFVDIPSVSADPKLKPEISKIAEVAANLFKQFGAEAQVIPTKGNPLIYGQFKSAANNPTVLVYNHLDVQPADASEWKHAPFNMHVENGIYRGRGTTDDKGPALALLFAARYAHENKFPLNIKFIWETEEEIGSPSFKDALKKHIDKFSTDSVVVSDTIWISREQPAVSYGLRGLQGALVKLSTGVKDIHSGTTGGLARNPIGELCQLIDECYDAKTGHVKIPGFYDDVKKLNGQEIDNFVQSGFNLSTFKKANELHSLRTNDVKDGAQRIWTQPTFEVHGIVGGYAGPGLKTIVPHSAEAKISMRLVPNQDPLKIFELFKAFVKEKCPDATIEEQGTLHPYLSEYTGKYYQAAAASMQRTFGKAPAFMREGGSIGAVVSMHELLKRPIVLIGLSLPEHGYHAINENFDWRQASGGVKLFIDYFDSLSRIDASN